MANTAALNAVESAMSRLGMSGGIPSDSTIDRRVSGISSRISSLQDSVKRWSDPNYVQTYSSSTSPAEARKRALSYQADLNKARTELGSWKTIQRYTNG